MLASPVNRQLPRVAYGLVVCHSEFDRQSFPWYAAAKTGGTDGQAISCDAERR
jgi:hypothetical protein